MRFILHYLRYSASRLVDQATGTTFDAIGGETLRSHGVEVPPRAEQDRIVDALESYLSRLDAAVANLERVQAKLKAYRASVLKAAVDGRLVPTEAELARKEKRDYEPAQVLLDRILKERRRRWEEAELARMKKAGKAPKDDRWKAKYVEPEPPDRSRLPELPEGWCWASVAQVGETITGTTPSSKTAEFYGGTIPFFKPTDLNAGEHVIAARQYLTAAGANEGRVLPAGSVLVTCIGATIGKVGLARVACTTNQQINALIADEPLMRTRWAFWFFMCPLGRGQVIGNASSTTLPILNKTRFERIAIPVPPVYEQERIVAEIERLVSIEEQVLSSVTSERSRVQRLRQSILKWAFEGKLVDQDPADEPAEKLVARIRAEREDDAMDGTRRRRNGKAKRAQVG